MAVLFVDTRQQADKHRLKHERFERAGYELARTKLYVGDYQLPGGLVAVDTKQSLAELAADIYQQHDRFRGELVRAQTAGIELWVLTETDTGVGCLSDLANWREPAWMTRRRKNARKPLDGRRMADICDTMSKKYGTKFVFCPPEQAGDAVLAILGVLQ